MESFGFVLAAAIFCLSVTFEGCQGATWSYSGADDGVNKWAENYPDFCNGQSQSPINLLSSVVTYDDSLEKFELDGFNHVRGVTWTMGNNGHTVTVNYDTGVLQVTKGSLLEAQNPYQVQQFHFHWGSDNTKGSEHLVDNSSYPMEVHIVTYNTRYGNLGSALSKSDGLAVLGFFFEIAANPNPTMQKIVDALPSVMYAGNDTSVDPFPLNDLMAGMDEYYRYQGGLTTPTCNEVVTWTVFKNTIKISQAQMNEFRRLMDSHNHAMVNNYRPVLPLYTRSIRASFNDPRFASASVRLVLDRSLASFVSCFLFLSFWLR